MLKKTKTTTQLMGAALMTGMLSGFSSQALAQSGMDDYVDAVGEQATGWVDIINLTCYIGGAVMAGLGVIGVKQHVDNPGQEPLKKPLSKLGVGGALLAFPFVANVVQDGLAGSGNTEFQDFMDAKI